MKKYAKLVCTLLVVVFLLPTLAACQNNSGGGTATSAATSAATAASSAAPANTSASNEPAPPESDLNPVTIKINSPGDAQGRLEVWDPENDEIAKIMADKFNITLIPVVYDSDDAKKLAGASGDLPDVFVFGMLYENNLNTFLQWVDQGIVRSIPDGMLDQFPNISNLIKGNATAQAANTLFGGDIYIPQPLARDPSLYRSSQAGIYVRKSWMQNLGLDLPSNLDELHTLLTAIVNNDPDGNGVKDTLGYTSNGGLGPLNGMTMGTYGIDGSGWVYVEDEGRWVPNYMTTIHEEPLKYLQTLYREGLIDPEITENTYVQSLQKFAQGAFGTVGRNSDTFWINQTITVFCGGANPGVNPLDEVDLIHMLAKDANSEPLITMNVTYSGTFFSNKCTDEQMERYMMLHEWIMTDEGSMLTNLGIEGKHYSVDANGKYTIFDDPATGAPYDMNAVSNAARLKLHTGWFMDLEMDTNWPSATIPNDIKEFSRGKMLERDQHTLVHDVRIQMISTPTKDNWTLRPSDTHTQIIFGNDDVATALASFREQCVSLGVETMIEEVNAVIKEYGITPPAR